LCLDRADKGFELFWRIAAGWKQAVTAPTDSFLARLCLLWTIAVGYAEHRSRSHDAVIRVYDEAGNVIETHEHKGWPQQTEFVQPRNQQRKKCN
jgi:hypothetical protein